MSEMRYFFWFSRLLHAVMALCVILMLFIGVTMVSSLKYYGVLMSIHRPLGIAVLILAFIRVANNMLHPRPALPPSLPPAARKLSHATESLFYLLMFLLPLIGWAMLSAEGYPIVLFGPVQLPAILPQNQTVYAILRQTHTYLALFWAALILMHFTAAMAHAMIFRDGVFQSMYFFGGKSGEVVSDEKLF